MKYCTNCGHQVKETDLFCETCGHRLDNRNNVPLEETKSPVLNTTINSQPVTQDPFKAHIAWLIVGMVLGPLFNATLLIVYASVGLWYIGLILFVLFTAPNLVVGLFALDKLKTAKEKDGGLIALGVLTIIFTSVVAGILILTINNEKIVRHNIYINTHKTK